MGCGAEKRLLFQESINKNEKKNSNLKECIFNKNNIENNNVSYFTVIFSLNFVVIPGNFKSILVLKLII